MAVGLFGRQVASHVPEDWKWLVPFRHLILPLTTLIVVTAAYGVLLLICGPFLQKTGKLIYNWIFVIGIASASIWLVVMWFLKSATLVAALLGVMLTVGWSCRDEYGSCDASNSSPSSCAVPGAGCRSATA